MSEEKKVKKIIKRIPWKEFIRSQMLRIIGFIISLIFMLIIITLSNKLIGDPNQINPSNIIAINQTSILLILLSSILFIAVVGFFTKVIFYDKKDEFGIESFKSVKSVILFLLTFSFLSMVYILLDTSLINVYLLIGPILLFWSIGNAYNLPIPHGVDRLAYAQIRSMIFSGLFVFNLTIPLLMIIVILSRLGRNVLEEYKERDFKPYTFRDFMKLILSIFLNIVFLVLYITTVNNSELPAVAIILGIILLGITIWTLFQIFIVIFRILRFTVVFTFSNIVMIVPIIFVFFILPGMMWALWDMFEIYHNGTIENTIYEFNFMSNVTPKYNPTSLPSLSLVDKLLFFIVTTGYNFGSVIRIIQLDFVIIVGISALVIGFAEGYSIVAILKSIKTGVAITRTGRIATRSAPRIIVITTKLFILLAWLSLIWDKFLSLWNAITIDLDLNLPSINLPNIFEPLYGMVIYLKQIAPALLPLTILLIPFYFIITSSFKFISVSIAVEKIKDDVTVFFLLITSTFILIVAKIYIDISSLPEFIGAQNPFLPINIPTISDIRPFIMKMVDILESIGFYSGVIYSFKFLLQKIWRKITHQKEEEEIFIDEEDASDEIDNDSQNEIFNSYNEHNYEDNHENDQYST